MKIEILYPEFCNLYGELANVRYLKESMSDIEVIETRIKDRPRFIDGGIDLVYMGTMTERAQKIISDVLRPYKAEIEALINGGQAFLITGNALEVFGGKIYEDDAEYCEGIGIFDFISKRSSINRVNHLYVGDFAAGDEKIQVVGFKSLFGYAYGDGLKENFCDTVLGYGTNEEIKEEGIRRNNFFGTYLIGPLLILNPIFTEWLMREVLHRPDEKPAYFKEAMEAYECRLDEYLNSGKPFVY